MPGTASSEQVPVDGGVMAALPVLPEPGTGPGVVVLQEIFGVDPCARRAAVCYDGSGIADALDAAADITCPVLSRFGEDPYIPGEQSQRVASLAAAREGMECHIHHGAGHAFDNHDSPAFHQPGAATAAGQLTDFLARILGPSDCG